MSRKSQTEKLSLTRSSVTLIDGWLPSISHPRVAVQPLPRERSAAPA